jgi:hypothetical protein
MTYSADDHRSAIKATLDALPPPLHVKAICKACPHPAECRGKLCLNDIARPLLEARGFSRFLMPSQALAVEAAFREGKSVRMIMGGLAKYGPAICTTSKFETHCAAYPIWGAEMKRMAAANALANNKLKGVPHKNTTHCRKGHELPTEPNWTHPPSARPRSLVGTRYVKCLICLQDSQRRSRVPGEEIIGKVMVRLLLKRPISSFTRHGEPDYILKHKHFTALRKAFPEIDRIVRENMKDANSRAQKERHRTDESEHTAAPAKKAKAAKGVELTYEAIDGAVPAHLPPDMRCELINDIWIAAKDGLITSETLEYTKKFVTSHNKMFPTKYAKFGNAPLVSLDATLYEDGTTTRGDMVSEGLWG